MTDICRALLFAPPPEGPEADLSEADVQREEALRHHRLLFALRHLHPILFQQHTKGAVPILEGKLPLQQESQALTRLPLFEGTLVLDCV